MYAYQKIIDNHIDPALGDVPLRKLTPMIIQEYYTETQRTSGLSSNTMRRHHDLLSSALRSAVRQDEIPASPMERVEPPRGAHRRVPISIITRSSRLLYRRSRATSWSWR